ncbi:MAG TPA: pyridoxal-dependent decarboxylase [Terracidiphilus sp.]|jgi:aromatic-L-amino-acid/L-tryptophan decarboxylase|nr:pyridoxal-dependent decarboxylase [Terracidiphilus sp.]
MTPLEISPAELRTLLDEISKLTASYLESLDSRPIVRNSTAAEMESCFAGDPPAKGLKADALQQLPTLIDNSRAQNGRFFGYVLGSGDPVGAATDLLASALNQNVTAWRSSPAGITIEKTVIRWLAESIGCRGFQGSLTGGGSSANLMGLAIAREAKLPVNAQGFANRRGTVYASEEVHMSIPKAVALLGIGRDNLRLVPTDETFHLIPAELDRAMRRDREAGLIPIAVVASAGTVNTGAVDPLSQIAEIARQHGSWFHIDGAYGALAAMAVRNRFHGLDLADSLSLDPHKWLYQPLDCGCLLFRDSHAARTAFAHTGEYARSLTADPAESFAFFEESLELSRRFRALKLWFALRYHGFDAFRDSIKNDLAHARRLAEAVINEPELELAAPLELSAVCFRYVGPGGLSAAELNRQNSAILKRAVERGKVYLSNATLRSKFCLRACIVNHRTTDADIDSVVPEVLAAAADLRSSS